MSKFICLFITYVTTEVNTVIYYMISQIKYNYKSNIYYMFLTSELLYIIISSG